MAKRKEQSVQSDIGRLVLHRFCGDEEFALSAAEMLAYPNENGVRLWFEVETQGKCIKPLEDTAALHARPQVSIRVDLPALVPNELVGRRFTPANRDQDGDPPGTIYYVEHDELRECAVEVVRRDGTVFEVRLSGVATDINYYDGSKPETRVEVAGRFTFATVSKWDDSR